MNTIILCYDKNVSNDFYVCRIYKKSYNSDFLNQSFRKISVGKCLIKVTSLIHYDFSNFLDMCI